MKEGKVGGSIKTGPRGSIYSGFSMHLRARKRINLSRLIIDANNGHSSSTLIGIAYHFLPQFIRISDPFLQLNGCLLTFPTKLEYFLRCHSLNVFLQS